MRDLDFVSILEYIFYNLTYKRFLTNKTNQCLSDLKNCKCIDVIFTIVDSKTGSARPKIVHGFRPETSDDYEVKPRSETKIDDISKYLEEPTEEDQNVVKDDPVEVRINRAVSFTEKNEYLQHSVALFQLYFFMIHYNVLFLGSSSVLYFSSYIQFAVSTL